MNFSAIEAHGMLSIYLIKGDSEKVTIRADKKSMDKIAVKNDKNLLVIKADQTISGERVLEAHVTYSHIDRIVAYGATKIEKYDMDHSNTLEILASGASEVKARVNVDSLKIRSVQAANVQLAGNTDIMDLSISGMGDVVAYNLTSKKCLATVNRIGSEYKGILRLNVTDSLFVDKIGSDLIRNRGAAHIVRKN